MGRTYKYRWLRGPDTNVLRRETWGTKWNAYDGEIMFRRPGYLEFEFNTAWNFPEPVYREIGRQFPKLMPDIPAIDTGYWWAVTDRSPESTRVSAKRQIARRCSSEFTKGTVRKHAAA